MSAVSHSQLAEPSTPAVEAKRLPSLDGLRGVAISLVVVSHGWSLLSFSTPGWILTIVSAWGSLGVELFFSLSGYLITYLLCREFKSTGRIGLKAFYLRRAVRILPPLFLFLGVVALLNVAGVLDVPWRQIVSCLFFYKNYLIGNNQTDEWYVGHLWSLSLEEQFYLLLPFALAFFGPKKTRKLAFVLVFAMPLARVGCYFLFPFPAARSILAGGIHSAVDRFLWGSLAALYREAGEPFFPASVLRSGALFYGVAGFFLCLIPFLEAAGGGPYVLILGLSLRSVCAIFIIVWLEKNLTSPASRFVNTRGMRALGLISYGVYLWQQLYLGERSHLFTGLFLLAVLACLGSGTISYFLMELPLTNLRRRLRQGSK